MATRLKTVEFAHPVLATLADNTLGTLTQITVYLPETGTKTFRSVIATLSVGPVGTATGNVTSRNLQCRLGAAAYTANSNANLYTGSGEDVFLFHAVDLTSHFTTNWTGTSMTFDSQVQVDGTWTGVSFVNVCVTLSITYEYDDTSTTQIKTVRIPLDAPVGAMGTTKPGTATATIPALNTELPEASKVYRSQHIVVQGNVAVAGATTDSTLSMQLDSTAAHTSGNFEGAAASDYWFRYVWDCSAVLDESISMGFYIWGSVARYNHAQAWLVVTYEFDASAANDVFVSLVLPVNGGGTMGGTTSSDYLRVAADLLVPESGIVSKQVAFYGFWEQIAAIAGLNMRVGTGSFVTYTDTAAQLCGSNGAMIRNDSAFTIARGFQTLTADAYRTDTSDLGYSFDGFFIVNYTCDKPTGGHGAVNHSVRWGTGDVFGGTTGHTRTTSVTPAIPETDYYLSSVGVEVAYYSNTTGNAPVGMIYVERLSGDGNITWDTVAEYAGATDVETGLHWMVADARRHFKRFPGDLGVSPDTVRRDVETDRRWRFGPANQAAAWHYGALWLTYHTQTWSITGTVTGSSGGTVTLTLHDAVTDEPLKEATRSGDGAYLMTWYDNTRNVYVVAREDDTHVGRSGNTTAA